MDRAGARGGGDARGGVTVRPGARLPRRRRRSSVSNATKLGGGAAEGAREVASDGTTCEPARQNTAVHVFTTRGLRASARLHARDGTGQ